MSVFSNVIKPQGVEPLQFPTKFRSHSAPVLTVRRIGFEFGAGLGLELFDLSDAIGFGLSVGLSLEA